VLDTHPLKSATSVVFAAQRAGYRHPALDRFRDLHLGFLERYFDYALEQMLPAELASHVRDEFAHVGIDPMDGEDERQLRTVGQTFWPERFTWERAGLGTQRPFHQR
jgi:hypothetical protein